MHGKSHGSGRGGVYLEEVQREFKEGEDYDFRQRNTLNIEEQVLWRGMRSFQWARPT
jgi:hypothetical protein